VPVRALDLPLGICNTTAKLPEQEKLWLEAVVQRREQIDQYPGKLVSQHDTVQTVLLPLPLSLSI
jgi:hypothetical protein